MSGYSCCYDPAHEVWEVFGPLEDARNDPNEPEALKQYARRRLICKLANEDRYLAEFITMSLNKQHKTLKTLKT